MNQRLVAFVIATMVATAVLGIEVVSAAAFTAGNLAVFRADGGGVALSNTGGAVFLDEFTTGGTLAQSIALPSTGGGPVLVSNATATSEGFIGRSPDGSKIAVIGYNRAVGGSGNLNTTASADVNRVVGVFDSTGAFDLYGFNDLQPSGNPRSVTVSNAGGAYFGTSNTGVRYADLTALTPGSTGNATSSISTTQTNVRNVEIIGDQLYVSSGSGAFRGVNTVGTGIPTTSDEVTSLLPGFDPSSTTQSVYDYWFASDTTLYVADDRSGASSGGIQKWALSEGTWSMSYVIPLGEGTGGGARGLIGDIVDGQAVLFATTTEASANRLVSVTDTGALSTVNLLSTAAANTVFRGVDFVPTSGSTPVFDVADFDQDTFVNGTDLQTLVDNFGTGTTNAQGDASGDSLVDGADVLIYQQHQVVSSFTAVPEPATVVLLVAGLAGLARRRR